MGDLVRCREQQFALSEEGVLLSGRSRCTNISVAGDFALTVKDIPDKYKVCASTADSTSIFEGDVDKGHRVVCS
jgi:hypothetical protein